MDSQSPVKREVFHTGVHAVNRRLKEVIAGRRDDRLRTPAPTSCMG